MRNYFHCKKAEVIFNKWTNEWMNEWAKQLRVFEGNDAEERKNAWNSGHLMIQ